MSDRYGQRVKIKAHGGMREFQGCMPRIICGRKVWLAERHNDGRIKEVWLHANPYRKANLYLLGSCLTEGSAEDNDAYLENLCAETVAEMPPLTNAMERLWDRHLANLAEVDREIEDLNIYELLPRDVQLASLAGKPIQQAAWNAARGAYKRGDWE